MAIPSLDHCVLPVRSLAVARERLAALGFTVAPDAAHPFGTANCCVFFEDGSYLEPLAVADEPAANAAIEEGNAFVSRDRVFRAARGQDGFSALVLRTSDAAADHARFIREHISAGDVLSFSRPFTDAGGKQAEASFRLAFAALQGSPDFFFTCERVTVPAVDRSALQRHENGAVGIAGIIAASADPGVATAFLDRFLGVADRAEENRTDWALEGARLTLMSPEQAQHTYGIDGGDSARLKLLGIVFRTTGLTRLRETLHLAGISFAMHEGSLVIPPSPGQGALFIFRETDT